MPPFERLVIILQVKYASICMFEKFVKTFVQLILQTSFHMSLIVYLHICQYVQVIYLCKTNETQKNPPDSCLKS